MNSLRNHNTFTSMLKKHQGILYKVANSYCKNISDRDDLIQEITIHIGSHGINMMTPINYLLGYIE